MAKCVAVSEALSALPLIGGGLEQAVALLGVALQWLITGVLAADPIALAVAAVGLILLTGLYQLTRVAASFLALAGFFVLVICAV